MAITKAKETLSVEPYLSANVIEGLDWLVGSEGRSLFTCDASENALF